MPILVSVILAVFLLLADQLTKYLVLQNLADGTVITILPRILQFRYVENTGMAFSLLEGRSWLLGIFTLAVCAALIVVLVKEKDLSSGKQLALLLIISGGLGNGIDRLCRHYVVDFIEVLFTDFAVFNLADCCITIGAILLIVLLLIDMIKEEKQKKQRKESHE